MTPGLFPGNETEYPEVDRQPKDLEGRVLDRTLEWKIGATLAVMFLIGFGLGWVMRGAA